MIYYLHTLCRTVTEEIDGSAVKKLLVCVGCHHVGTGLAHLAQRAVIDGSIHLHAACVDHRTQQGVLLQVVVAQQHRHAEQLERRHRDELQVATHADALSHGHADAQTGVRTWSAAHSHRVKRYGVAIGKRHCLINKHSQFFGVVGAGLVLIVIDAGAVLTHSHGAHICARINTQNT